MNCVEIVFALCWKHKKAVSKVEKDLSFGNGYFKSLKRQSIPSDRLEKLSDYFGVSIDFLLGVGPAPYLLVTEHQLYLAEKAYKKEPDSVKKNELAMQIDLLQESVEDQKLGNALIALQEAKKAPDAKIGRDNVNMELYTRFSALDAHGRDAVSAIMEIEETRMKREAEREPAEIVPIRTIRHYFEGPAAGVNGLVDGEDYEDIPLPAGAPNDADYCLTVSGDSMEPYFADGEMVYVKRDVPLRDFDVGVFAVDGATYIKQFCRGVYGETYLLSANPKRESANITIKPDGNQNCVCQGKVLTKKKLPKPVYG